MNDRCHYCGYPRRAMIHLDTWWGGHKFVQAPEAWRDIMACILYAVLIVVIVTVAALAVLTFQGGPLR